MLQVIRGRVAKPRKIVLYGVAGVGKNTWAAGAPDPIFIQTEEGSEDIGCARLPMRRTLPELQKDLRDVLLEDHEFRTLVVDTGDGVEALIHASVVAGAGSESIAGISFGRGYDAAVLDMRKILFVLDKIRDVRGMTVIILAHAKISRFEDPGNEAYDRYSLQMHHKAAAEVMGWADEVLFANYKTFVRKTEQGFRERNVAVGTGERFLFTREMPAYYAKNRLDLPPEMPMPKVGGWDEFAKYLHAGDAPQQDKDKDQAAGVAAPEAAPSVPDAASCEPVSQAPAAISAEPVARPAMTGPAPAEVQAAAEALGMEPVDLDTLDVDQLREIALPLASKFSKTRAAEMRKAIKNRDAEKMREIIRYVMTKPDVSGISGED